MCLQHAEEEIHRAFLRRRIQRLAAESEKRRSEGSFELAPI